MIESLAFYGFMFAVVFVIYRSIIDDDEAARGSGRKGKFSMKDARARSEQPRTQDGQD